jgi:hypothetical protein
MMERKHLAQIETLLPGALKMLSKCYNPAKNPSEIVADMKTYTKSPAKTVYNVLSYLQTFDADGWLDIDTRRVAMAVYLSLTTWDEELGKKYGGEDSVTRQRFIAKIA